VTPSSGRTPAVPDLTLDVGQIAIEVVARAGADAGALVVVRAGRSAPVLAVRGVGAAPVDRDGVVSEKARIGVVAGVGEFADRIASGRRVGRGVRRPIAVEQAETVVVFGRELTYSAPA